jgi:hypothetical protein
MIKRGCQILVALVLLQFLVLATADEQYHRPDIVACLDAVDQLELPFDSIMTQKCMDVSLAQCGAAVAGPKSACIKDIADDVVALVTVRRTSLPEDIEGDSFKAKSYKRTLERIDAALAGHRECPENLLDRPELCELITFTVAWMGIPRAARFADIELP